MIDSDGIVKIGTINGVIHGVSIADLQTTLGTSKSDIGQIIVDGAINMFAKHKPFRHSAPGFALDRTQATPELRSPTRMAQLLAANYGLSIPKFNASDFKTHYSDAWTYLKPRGRNGGGTGVHEHFNIPDFDGYLHNNYWNPGPVGIYGLYTIFNGYLSTPRTNYIFPGDLITMDIQCAEDPDTGLPGLLYPYDFYREQQHAEDISRYYLGIAIITNGGQKLWIITGDQMRAHHTTDDVVARIEARLPVSITPGEGAKVIPVLTSSQYSDWDDAPGQGNFISLNGAFLTRTIGSASSKLTVGIAITYNNGSITMAFTVANNTSSIVNLGNLYAYIMSAESYYNEGDGDHNPPTSGSYGTREYIEDNWPTAAPYGTDAYNHMGLSNPPDIYLSDFISGLTPPAYLTAKGYNAYADFYAANNNSSTIAIGGTVSWTKVMNIGTEDGCGYYADGIFVAACLYVHPMAYVEYFTDLTD